MTAGIGKPKKALAALEYLVLGAVFVLAAVSIQVYIARAIKGRLKSNVDSIGEQYSPVNSSYSYRQLGYSRAEEIITESGRSTSTLLDNEVSGKTAYTDDFSDKPLVGKKAERLFE